jgi:hypothetical protein
LIQKVINKRPADFSIGRFLCAVKKKEVKKMGSGSDGNYAALRAAARISGGEILRDARGMPDFFAVLTSDLEVNGQKPDRLLMGKYEACARLGGLYALPLESPRTGLTFEMAAALA